MAGETLLHRVALPGVTLSVRRPARPARLFVTRGAAPSLPHLACPTLGVWSDRDTFLGRDQMSASERFVDGPWRYEELTGVDDWIPARAPDQLNALLLDHLG
jgi:pimeloyl-ACP methyl ester carboxylesterase